MSQSIRQCIPADRDAATAFVKAQGDGAASMPDLSSLDCQSSLVALEGEEIKGVALCFRLDPASAARQLSVVTAGNDPELLRMLVDKAMAKLASHGLHKCRVLCGDGQEPADRWGASQWPPREEEKPTKDGKKKGKAKNAA